MSARDIISLIETLSPSELGEIIAFVDSKKTAIAAQPVPGTRMSFQDAKKHVFTEYRDVLERLAK